MRTLIISLLFSLCLNAFSNVVIYPKPRDVLQSSKYKVNVHQGKKTFSPFVYFNPSTHPSHLDYSTSHLTFSFSKSITVEVERLNGEAVKTCIIRPQSYGIKPIIKGNKISFTLDQPRMISVEMDSDTQHSMLVFALPLENNIPKKNDPQVVYFEPGIHNIGDFKLPKGKTQIYIAGGAYIKGRFDLRKDVSIYGRGIISGENYTYETNIFRSLVNVNQSVEGITILNSPHYNLHCKNANWVKCISWYGQTDGIHINKVGHIQNCFLKVNDDALKLYNSNILVENTVIWQLYTGAPFQLSWNLEGETRSNIVCRNIDIIHNDWETEHINRAIWNSLHGGGADLKGYLFENIRIEGDTWRLMRLAIKRTRYGNAPKLGSISQIQLKNITVEGNILHPNILKGSNDNGTVSTITEISFENLSINDKPAKTAEQSGGWIIDEKTAKAPTFF